MTTKDNTFPFPVPPVPGLIFRPLRPDDAAALVAVQESRAERDKIDPLSTFEGIPTLKDASWFVAHKAKTQTLDTVLTAEVNGIVVGYTWLDWWTETTGVRLFISQSALQPLWRGQGIGTALLGWAETRLREIALLQPETGEAFFGANATEAEEDDTALLLHAGYQRSFSVTEFQWAADTPLPVPPLPAGLAIRPLQTEHFLAVGRAVTEAYADDPSLCFVAWDGDQVAGQVLCRVDKGRGELAEVSVRQPWRRRGLAKALLVRAIQAFGEHGVTEVRLHTVAENQFGSVSLYQGIGFRVIKAHVRYRKPMNLSAI